MLDDSPCGRPVEAGEEGKCILHSENANKNHDSFKSQLRKIVANTDVDSFDLTSVVFTHQLDWGEDISKKLTKPLYFIGAHFKGDVDLSDLEFQKKVLFQNCDFIEANFSNTKFEEIEFIECQLEKGIFDGINGRTLRLQNVAFTGDAQFLDRIRIADAEFAVVNAKRINLREAEIKNLHITNVVTESLFAEGASFSSVKIRESELGSVHFAAATFRRSLEVTGQVHRELSTFGAADFDEVTFEGDVRFEGTPTDKIFSRKKNLESRFTNVRFGRECRCVFQRVDLHSCLLAGTDLKSLELDRVDWNLENGRRILYDQSRLLASTERDNVDSALEYERIAKAYRQLRDNFEKNLEYAAASDFHVGEMEMERLKPTGTGSRLRLWYRRYLSLLAFYRHLSLYGASYERTAFWMLVTVLFFGFLYLFAGIEPQPEQVRGGTPTEIIIYRLDLSKSGVATLFTWNSLANYARATLLSLGAFSFRVQTPYRTVSAWGSFFEMLESTIGAILIAMFLLAVRRRLKR
ncbi:pentapeptide repeat-containing protein [Acidobacteriia bacterium AH_259_A11_L15]|nr:pentapeptide repeat-containing protein [Acidobacteriia bacterium AH_259_A11_L15]